MAKESFYFPHDYNAADDIKCLFLRQQLGMEGYGIFWYLVEKLANAGGELPLNITPVLSMQMQVPEIKVKAVIESFGLFEIKDNTFFSRRLNEHLSIRQKIKEGAIKGAESRWKNAGGIAGGNSPVLGGAMQSKESKEKESSNTAHVDLSNSNLYKQPNIPTYEKVKEVFQRMGGTGEQAYKFFLTNEATGWFYKNNPIVKFENLVPTYIASWNANQNKNNPPTREFVM